MSMAGRRASSRWRNLLEEIVGEIEDEYDAPVTSVVVNADGSYGVQRFADARRGRSLRS